MNRQQVPQAPVHGPWCQRWRPGRQPSWRHRTEGGFDARRYESGPLEEAAAKGWIVERHYSGTYPAARLRYGMWDTASEHPRLVGVGVLSVPTNARTLTNAFPGLSAYTESVELGRFVLADEVPANGESWFIGQILRSAAADGVRGIVSFADPVARTRPDGAVVFPGHLGIIYQVANFTYTGRGTARTRYLLPDGTELSERALSKIRKLEQGHEYATRQLLQHGARPRRPGHSSAAWLRQALTEAGVQTARHPGNHRYCVRVGRTRAERTRVMLALAADRYPKTAGNPQPDSPQPAGLARPAGGADTRRHPTAAPPSSTTTSSGTPSPSATGGAP
jgi:hypothetical protein